MSKARGCRYVQAYWPRFTPAMRFFFSWIISEDRTMTMCPKESKRRKSDGKIFLELHPINKDACDFCKYAEK